MFRRLKPWVRTRPLLLTAHYRNNASLGGGAGVVVLQQRLQQQQQQQRQSGGDGGDNNNRWWCWWRNGFLAASGVATAASLSRLTISSCEDGLNTDPFGLGAATDAEVYAVRIPTKGNVVVGESLRKSMDALDTTMGAATGPTSHRRQQDEATTNAAPTNTTKTATKSMEESTTATAAAKEQEQQQDESTMLVASPHKPWYRTPGFQLSRVKKFMLFASPSSLELGADVAHLLGIDLHRVELGRFSDGESSVRIQDSVRGKQVYIVTSTTSTDALAELLLFASAAHRASAKKVTAVIPYFGYARQDRKVQREPIAAADVVAMLPQMGIDQVMTLDLHDDRVTGFFPPKLAVEQFMPGSVAAAFFHEHFMAQAEGKQQQQQDNDDNDDKDGLEYPKVTVVATHEGQVARAQHFRLVLQRLSGVEVDLACVVKERQTKDQSDYQPVLVGNVEGRDCILVDDIVQTGKTMKRSIETLKASGANRVYAWATHGVFGQDIPEALREPQTDLEYLLVSNSVQAKELPPTIQQLSVAPLLAEAIARSAHHQPVSDILMQNFDTTPERYDG